MSVRRVLAGASLVVPPLVILGSWAAWRGDLPARVASHWSADSATPDGTSTTTSLLAGTLVAAVVVAVVALVVTFAPLTAAVRRGSLGLLGFVGGMTAGVWLVPAWVTLRAGSADDAVLGGWVLALIGCGAYAAVPYLLAPLDLVPPGPSAPREPFGAPAGRTQWSQTITASLFGVFAAVLLVSGLVVLAGGLGSGNASAAELAVPLVLAGTIVALFARMRVSVDRRGLRVTSAVLGFPLKRVPLERIASVAAIDVEPLEWGGWGYRVMPGRSAIVLRGGPGLAVTTTGGTQFAVTVEHPEVPAAVLETLRGR